MFSIAAINDTDSRANWEPLAPTKEAQESHLSQTYHEGLLKLQAKDYAMARELFETVLKDPLISASQVTNSANDGHLLQLRFLSLKNLATVFVQQGSMHYESALQCYIQAVEIDNADSVVWNHLGTLSCSMGLLSTSRWAFEQGLLCSPNNWNCMEKLLEVLIAIGDEVACLSVAHMILRHWPSHCRALYVKTTIEDAEPIPFAPRGIDKLEPKHVRLKFPDKRKATDDEIDENAIVKRHKQNIELQLAGATWAILTDAILGILLHTAGNASKCRDVLADCDDVVNGELDNEKGKVISGNASRDKCRSFEKIERYSDIKIDIHICTSSEIITDQADRKQPGICPIGESSSLSSCGIEKTSIVKEKEICADKEHHQERRSTRLERLRSRKSGKEDSETSGKDLEKIPFHFLEPFVLNRPKAKGSDSSGSSRGLYPDILTYSSAVEYNDVERFISGASMNYGAYHIGHLLLEEVAHINITFRDNFLKFLELEKLTRHWGQDRTPLCSLFLAELYYDQGSLSANQSTRSELLSEASYHLCKVIELVALDSPFDIIGHSSTNAMGINDSTQTSKLVDCTAENGQIPLTDKSPKTHVAVAGDCASLETVDDDSISTSNTVFWVRFFWLSGRLSLLSGSKAKAFDEFCICLSLLRKDKKFKEIADVVFLPHCKFVKMINIDIILHEINLLKLDALLGKETDEMIEKGAYTKCIKLLAPLLLSVIDVPLDGITGASKESGCVPQIELSALDVLMLACEKEESMNIEVYLSCHRRKLQLLTIAAGMVISTLPSKDKSSLPEMTAASDSDNAEVASNHWIHVIAEEVKNISRCASQVKNCIDQNDTYDGFSSLVCIIGDIQSLLLTIICSVVRRILSQRCHGLGSSNQANQLESWCLVDAAIAFCKLQHLDPSIPVKAQVDLIVSVHDFLAEFGLCCAGRDGEAEEAAFLKLAIKHLLALDLKLKSLNGTNGKEESVSLHKDALEDSRSRYLGHEESDKDEEVLVAGKNGTDVKLDSSIGKNERNNVADADSLPVDLEIEKVELGIENALDQCFFCLYGLNINPDSSSEDDLALHKNTTRGDYQTKEQCADVFHYILPYAGVLSRAGLVKLRRVLRAIRKHFPQPPSEVLAENEIENFLDGSSLCEDKLCEVSGSDGSREYIMSILFTNGRCPETIKIRSEPYLEVYGNLYYCIARAEEISATDKYPGFVLKKEGEEFVEQNANLFKYDLLYNPLRFESWQKLANIYDEEVDLLLNDGSKHINVVDWRRNIGLPQRVEAGRRRSRRCLVMSLALARTPVQQSQIHELLALVYYDSLQNVVPFYDQRSIVPTKDAAWMTFCQNSMKHFEKAFALRPDWLYAFYLGKLCEKMGYSSTKAFSHYSKAASLNPSAVDPVYRIHASRLKLLYSRGKRDYNILQIVAAYAFSPSTKETILNMLNWIDHDLNQLTSDVKDVRVADDSKDKKDIEPCQLDIAWHLLYDDCLSALRICVEGELKHFHKARYMLARGLYKRGEDGDLERAKDELSFCFKSSRSSFTINMWEIDGTAKKGRRKHLGPGVNKRILEVSLSESSRKFITCIRKYILFYLNLLEKTEDLCTLERAYVYLRTDKRFALCIGDIVPVALGKYIQVLTSSIHKTESHGASDLSLEQMLERIFSLFMDHVNIWTEISSLPEVKSPELSEGSLYGYIHQYIHLLEKDVRLDAVEGINEKIRKRFKNPKLSSTNVSKICKHASLAWCHCILIKLVLITPLSDAQNLNDQLGGLESGLLLFVDLQLDEFLSSTAESFYHPKLDRDRFHSLCKIKHIRIRQALEENMEAAVALMRCAYNFYRESSCGALPSGISLYTVFSSQSAVEGLQQPNREGVDLLDLSVPRKLLLWAYTLVHGRYSNISSVVKYCEENAKSRLKRATTTSSALSQSNIPAGHTHTVAGAAKERNDQDDYNEIEDNPSVIVASTSLHQEEATYGSFSATESERAPDSSPLLYRCNATLGKEN